MRGKKQFLRVKTTRTESSGGETIYKNVDAEKSRVGKDRYTSAEEASDRAEVIGCSGYHTHTEDGETVYMPCSSMSEYQSTVGGGGYSADEESVKVASVPTYIQKNAQRGLDLLEFAGDGLTDKTKREARDMANGKVSDDKAKRMAAWFARHESDLDSPRADAYLNGDSDRPTAGQVAWLLWGGDLGKNKMRAMKWAERQSDSEEKSAVVPSQKHIRAIRETEDSIIIEFGKSDMEEKPYHDDEEDEDKGLLGVDEKQVSDSVRTGLQRKADEHNEDVGDDKTKRTTLRTLIAVFERGVGAYETNPQSVRPSVTSPEQWAYARVNSFLYALRNGKFRSGKHDTDLLPKGHPQSSKGASSESAKVEDIAMQIAEGEISLGKSMPAHFMKRCVISTEDEGKSSRRFSTRMEISATPTDPVYDGNRIVDYQNVSFRGYASTNEDVTKGDRIGDYLRKGAFRKTIKEFRKNPVMLIDHENSVRNIAGSYTKLVEDDTGLYVEGKISNAPELATVRPLVAEGHLKTLSIGGMFYYEDDGKAISEVDLMEVSLVAIPMNPDARFEAIV